MREIWKPISGFEGYYDISTIGRVRSRARRVARSGHTLSIPQRILRATANTNGYMVVSLWKNGRQHMRAVHRLIAIAFVPNPDPERFEHVDHINGVRTDNDPSNLRWADYMVNGINLHKARGDRPYPVGVYHRPKCRKNPWCAQFMQRHLGCFSTIEEAVAARTSAAKAELSAIYAT